MQFSFFLVIAAAILLIFSASVDADTSLFKTAATDIVRVNDVGLARSTRGRFLRTSDLAVANYDDEERGLPSVLSEKAASTASKLTRSKSLQAEKAAVQKLTRSKSLSKLESNLGLVDIKNVVESSLWRDYKTMDKMKKTPDDVITFFNLDRSILATGDRQLLREAAKGDWEKLGHYELWYRYANYYALKYPGWASKLV